MSLIINIFHSNVEIFLRQLISDPSGALDKIRCESITDFEKIEAQLNFFIKIIPDRTDWTMTIKDSDKERAREQKWGVAKSGTKAFVKATSAGGDIPMIGQFGAGFCPVYLVSYKNNDDEQHFWETAAGGCFTGQEDTEMVHGKVERGRSFAT